MKEWGFGILRFTNDMVEKEPEIIVQQIDDYLYRYNSL